MNTMNTRYTAFEGYVKLVEGSLADVAATVRQALDRGERAPILIFQDGTGEQTDVDLRGTAEDIRARLQPVAQLPETKANDPGTKGPGRPKLGVVAREVTLLPRHWDWLNEQPGGASVALRKLVEDARKANEGKDRIRRSREAAYRFMNAMGGNLGWFEEASRALFAGNRLGFIEHTESWPIEVREYARGLAADAFADEV